MKTVAKYYELEDTHPRAAAWLNNEGLIYIHEYPTIFGQIDFLTIHPESGHISVVECKVAITSASGVVSQIERYRRGLEIPEEIDTSKIGLSLLPVSRDTIREFERLDAEVYDLTVNHTVIEIDRYRNTYPVFSEVYRKFYGEAFPDGYALREKRSARGWRRIQAYKDLRVLREKD